MGTQPQKFALVAGWTYSADILELWCYVMGSYCQNGLFDAHSSTHNPYLQRSIWRKIIALLGQPPKELLQNGQKTPDFFHADGNNWVPKTTNPRVLQSFVNLFSGTFKHPALIPQTLTFASSLASIDIPDAENIFSSPSHAAMLQWLPSNRATAQELPTGPWILEGIRLRGGGWREGGFWLGLKLMRAYRNRGCCSTFHGDRSGPSEIFSAPTVASMLWTGTGL